MRALLIAIELLLLSALVLTTRAWNHDRVFVGHDIYFTDADCYSRMSRVRLCWEHPGTIVRHHDFENYPEGTVPHTTAPFDYLIVALAVAMSAFASGSLDFAGAWISPLLAVGGGIFLWFWMYRVGFRYRWPALLLYAVSPILVHGTELGRPDHQSFLIVLVILALCGEWIMATKPSRSWGVLTGISWAMALWVSFYEPLLLFVLTQALLLFWCRATKGVEQHGLSKYKWRSFLVTILISEVLERRVPSLSFLGEPFVRNWGGSIGELQHVPVLSFVWFEWGGFLLLLAPLAFFVSPKLRRNQSVWLGLTAALLCLSGVLFALTVWQARWGYFLVAISVVLLPGLLEAIRSRVIVWAVFLVSLWPVASAWDAQLWPSETTETQYQEENWERIGLRELAVAMRSTEVRPFLAPWWLSPELAYWSGQPGVAGSSHESFPGILATARFYSSLDAQEAGEILNQRRVAFVVAYDGERVAQTSEKILGTTVSPAALCYRLDRFPAQAPSFLQLVRQNSGGKLYQAVNNR
jgi:hypothetical protein